MFRILTLLVLLAAQEPRVSIKVSSQTVFAGQSLVITCTVPHHVNNRKVTASVVGYTSSERQLDGENAPKTIRFEMFHHVPCEAEAAACVLEDVYKTTQTAWLPLQIAGCDQ